MPNSFAKRSADPWLRDPTATAAPESVSRRSVANALAIPPVPRIPHRTGLSTTSLFPSVGRYRGDQFKRRGHRLDYHAVVTTRLALDEPHVLRSDTIGDAWFAVA